MWICKKCGGEVNVRVGIMEDFEFSPDKDGKPDEFYDFHCETLEEYIRKNHFQWPPRRRASPPLGARHGLPPSRNKTPRLRPRRPLHRQHAGLSGSSYSSN